MQAEKTEAGHVRDVAAAKPRRPMRIAMDRCAGVVTRRNAIALAFVVGHGIAAAAFLRSFPHGWSWSELLVDYQGGFTKRALVGAVTFLLRHAVAPQNFLAGLVFAFYAALSIWFVVGQRMSDRLSGLLFLFSPLGWLWPFLVSPAYGRKDVFVVAAAAVCHAMAGTRWRTSTLWFAAMAVFVLAGLVVEVAWFYCPIVLAGILLRRRGDSVRSRWALAAIGGAYCLACLLATVAIPPVDTAAIAASWSPAVFPNSEAGALCCLNFPIARANAIAAATAHTLGGGFALAALFGSAPIVLLLSDGAGRLLDRHSLAFMTAAVAFSTGPLFLAADWGRYIYLTLTITFCSLWAGALGTAPAGIQRLTPASVLLIGLYASMWQTTHWQFPDKNAFVPGILFRALNESFMPVGAD